MSIPPPVYSLSNHSHANHHDAQASDAVYQDAFISDDQHVEKDLNVTEDDLLEAKELAATFSLEETRDVSQNAGA